MHIKNNLKITEIFYSLQGESKTVGCPTVFIRLTGCPLRCQYCDTAYAFQGGKMMSLEEIIETVKIFKTKYITITGGEPLAQPLCFDLMNQLCELNYCVSLETSGALDVSRVDKRVVKVIDLKTPGSNEVERNHWQNIEYLLPHDQIKFVICDREDYQWAKKMINTYRLTDRCEVLFSPSYQQINNDELADWILQDQLPVRFQLQMHKYIWGDVAGK